MIETLYQVNDLAEAVKYNDRLVKENKELYKEIERLQEENLLLKASEPMSKLAEDYGYKTRCEKAIEYIEKWQNFQHTNGTTHEELKNLKGILKGE